MALLKWFIVHQGKEIGPYSTHDIKEMATSGKLSPMALIRREDKQVPSKAASIKGLFPDPNELPPPPPPLTQHVPVAPSEPSAAVPEWTGVPALWNPKALRYWSFLFSWVFGSILMAKNWRALGRPDRARRLMIWCYATIPYALLCLVTPDSPFWTGFFRLVSTTILILWIVIEAGPQIRLVKKQFGDNYPRKKWGLPLGIAGGCLLGFCVLSIAAVLSDDDQSSLSFFGESGDIQMVRNGYLYDYPGTPVGKAIDHFLASPRWEKGTTAAGQHFVNVRGGMTYQGKPVNATIQFLVNREAKRFEFYAFELNDIAQNEVMKHALMQKVFEEYRR